MTEIAGARRETAAASALARIRSVVGATDAEQAARALARALEELLGPTARISVAIRRGATLDFVHPGGRAEMFDGDEAREGDSPLLRRNYLRAPGSPAGPVLGCVDLTLATELGSDQDEAVIALGEAAAARLDALARGATAAEATRLAERFADRFSHDVRTPITSIMGMAQTLHRRDQLSDDIQDEFLDRIEMAARNLDDIVEASRATLEADEDRLALDIVLADAGSIAKIAADRAQAGALGDYGASARMTVEAPPGGLKIATDVTVLTTALATMAAHAIARARSSVEIACASEADMVRFSVTDDGPPPGDGEYDEALLSRKDAGTIGRTRGDPMELVAAVCAARALRGTLGVGSEGGRILIELLIPAAGP